MKILNSKFIVEKITKELKEKIKKSKYKPKLCIFQLGDNKSSNKYIKVKMIKSKELGVETTYLKYGNISQEELILKIKEKSKVMDGIIVQLPLPKQYDTQLILNSIPYLKDIDGLSLKNNIITPATPRGIMTLLKEYKIEIKNKIVAVVGQSNLVGKPISILCEKEGAFVRRFNSTTGLSGTELADILIVAVGKKKLIQNNNIKKNVVIIDVGINPLSNNKIVGDIDLESIKNKPYAISPVPGGVGPMTVISLFQNLIDVTLK